MDYISCGVFSFRYYAVTMAIHGGGMTNWQVNLKLMDDDEDQDSDTDSKLSGSALVDSVM